MEIRGDQVLFTETNNTYNLSESSLQQQKLQQHTSDNSLSSLQVMGPYTEEAARDLKNLTKYELKEYGEAYKSIRSSEKLDGQEMEQEEMTPIPETEEEAIFQAILRENATMALFLELAKNKTLEDLNQAYLKAGVYPEPMFSDARRRIRMTAYLKFNASLPLPRVEFSGKNLAMFKKNKFMYQKQQQQQDMDTFQDFTLMTKADWPLSLFEGLSGVAAFLADLSNWAKSGFPLFEV